jgi:hypothetical protein
MAELGDDMKMGQTQGFLGLVLEFAYIATLFALGLHC